MSASAVPSLAACGLALVGVKLALKLAGFGRAYAVASWLLRKRASQAAGGATLGEAVRRVAQVAAFFPGRALCLEQSLTLWYLLRRRGIEANLRLGVQAYPFGAHAWVEHLGQAVNESPELVRTFAVLPSFAR